MDQLLSRTLRSSDAAKSKYNNIQILRAIAAFFVVLYHSQHYLGVHVGQSAFASFFGGQLGFFGVTIFFAISGFLMGEIVTKTDPWTFILHRAARIYPPYYLAVLCSISILYFMPWQPTIDILGSSLVPGFAPGTLGIEWTLVFETFFYVMLFAASLVGLAKHIELMAAVWLAAILLASIFVPAWQTNINLPLSLVPISSMNIAFVSGLLIRRLMKMAILWPFVLFFSVPMVAVTIHGDLMVLRWAGSLSCALVVGAAAQMSQVQGRNWLTKAIIRFGDWSYATYLLHCTIFWVLFQACKGYPHPTRIWLLGLLLVTIVTVIAGKADVALYRRLRSFIDKMTEGRKMIAGGAYIILFAAFCMIGILR